MRGKLFSFILIIITFLLLTGCGSKKSNSINKEMIGKYELYEITSKDSKYTAQRWKELTSLIYSLEIKEDNIAIITKSSENKDMEYYSFDKEYFYKKDINNSDKEKKIYSYEYKDSTLKLTLLEGEYKNVYVYKK